ncbi:glycosyltransferase family 4 protein [Tortispora caseinolytica NRRL Y-17796]|uniref:Alpha-1,3/1,6-mannosyltransferase ALG2 n=1 Tax=Tortispora caseinolytica NRRL Y-17796 TaxID=767744 RepID=A0A1E4TKC9_9ASCO|nr:glycosyltransferase family 4 protein [Tortispora caseinolytica NRRL Y-17796]
MKVTFIHPDLGLGGAERLVLDAALGLQDLGHEVSVYTSHCDRNHAFMEIKKGLIDYHVYGDFFPRSIAGKFHIIGAIVRQLYLSCFVPTDSDVYIVDQLSASLPLLRLRSDSKIVFYCHFPDQLLAQRSSTIRSIYRLPWDWLEQVTTAVADEILVNSKFTRSVFAKTFTFIKRTPDVIYPCVPIAPSVTSSHMATLIAPYTTVLSINRFERKKNVELAIKAYAKLIHNPSVGAEDKLALKLVIAGGYDPRVSENIEYLSELCTLAKDLRLSYCLRHPGESLDTIDPQINVLFLPSITDSEKTVLLENSRVLLYTPAFEHFGIVPLEAMYAGTPVLAVNSGGPTETVKEDVTGWLRDADDTEAWAKVLYKVCFDDEFINSSYSKMVDNGINHIHNNFSREAMADAFEKIIEKVIKQKHRPPVFLADLTLFTLLFSALAIPIIAFLLYSFL